MLILCFSDSGLNKGLALILTQGFEKIGWRRKMRKERRKRKRKRRILVGSGYQKWEEEGIRYVGGADQSL